MHVHSSLILARSSLHIDKTSTDWVYKKKKKKKGTDLQMTNASDFYIKKKKVSGKKLDINQTSLELFQPNVFCINISWRPSLSLHYNMYFSGHGWTYTVEISIKLWQT